MDVIVESIGSLGRIRLNRPQALNALNHGMVRTIDAALDRFAEDQTVACILLTGEGDRGLCAGGDLRAFYEDPGSAEDFWRDEYRLNARIASFEKPFVAVMDGITMGGGVGLSAHARHRVATERSRIATPETGIGYIPDVGATWLLPRAPGEIGTYLGLVGEAIGAADAIHAGLADTMVSTEALPDLFAELACLAPGAGRDAVQDLLARHAQPAGPGPVARMQPLIDGCFAFDGASDILAALEADGSDFAGETAGKLKSKAPRSLVMTLHLLRLGRAALSLEDCLERELQASMALLQEGDFREGIRAAVIDKDRKPRWSPALLADVDPGLARRWLTPRAAPVFPERAHS